MPLFKWGHFRGHFSIFYLINAFKTYGCIFFLFLLSHHSIISQSQLKFTETYYNRPLPALDCILTITDTPQSLHAYGVHLGGYASDIMEAPNKTCSLLEHQQAYFTHAGNGISARQNRRRMVFILAVCQNLFIAKPFG